MRAEIANARSEQRRAIDGRKKVMHGAVAGWVLRMYQTMCTSRPLGAALDRAIPKTTAGRSANDRRSKPEYFPSLGW